MSTSATSGRWRATSSCSPPESLAVPDDLDAVVAQQRRHAVAHERRVVGDHDPQRPPAALAPAHLVDHHPASEPRQAHFAPLPETQIRLVADQLPDQRRRPAPARAPRAAPAARPAPPTASAPSAAWTSPAWTPSANSDAGSCASWIATAQRTASAALRNATAEPPAVAPTSTPPWRATQSETMHRRRTVAPARALALGHEHGVRAVLQRATLHLSASLSGGRESSFEAIPKARRARREVPLLWIRTPFDRDRTCAPAKTCRATRVGAARLAISRRGPRARRVAARGPSARRGGGLDVSEAEDVGDQDDGVAASGAPPRRAPPTATRDTTPHRVAVSRVPKRVVRICHVALTTRAEHLAAGAAPHGPVRRRAVLARGLAAAMARAVGDRGRGRSFQPWSWRGSSIASAARRQARIAVPALLFRVGARPIAPVSHFGGSSWSSRRRAARGDATGRSNSFPLRGHLV